VIVLDTNVLLYALGGEHPAREPARLLFDAVGEGRVNATTTVDVIQEFAHVYSRRRPRGEAVSIAVQYASLLAPLSVAGALELESGLRLFERYEGLGASDAVLAATAQANEARALVSADRAFAAVESLPFVELGSREFDRLIA
jgi:predicted nucleic acid-binding protein